MSETFPKQFEKKPEAEEKPEKERDFYKEGTNNFISSLKADPRLKDLEKEELESLGREIKNESKKYKERENSLRSKILKRIKETALALGISASLLGIFASAMSPKIAQAAFEKEVKIEHVTEYTPEEIARGKLSAKLEEKVGIGFLQRIYIDAYGGIESEEERKNIEKTKPEIKNFEKFKIPQEIMESAIETYPPSFLSNVNEISYSGEEKFLGEVYGKKLKSNQLVASAFDFERKIVVHKGAETESPEWVLNQMLAHEMAHLNDWDSNKFLTLNERLELLHKITKRLESEDRFYSAYVESVENEDKKKENSIKATEYFAEIVGTYFSDDYYLLSKADKQIVKEFLEKVDPLHVVHSGTSDCYELAKKVQTEPVS